MKVFIIMIGAKMHYLEIGGEQFGSNDLIGFVTTKLTEIGVTSFHSINVDTQKNHIDIQFDEIVDANITRAIADRPHPNNSKKFESKDAKLFMIALFETSIQIGMS